MKKLVSALAVVLALLGAAPAAQAQPWGSITTALNAVTTTGASSAVRTEGSTAVLFHVYSASTSSATIQLRLGMSSSAWFVGATITDPDAAGELWACPAAHYASVNASVLGSGTITALVASRTMSADPIGTACKKVSVSANTFGALSVTSLTNSGLTSGRVPYSGSGGLAADEAAFAYDASTNTLSADVFKGAYQSTVTAKASDGAIASAPGAIVITKTSALGSSTLATPTTTTHDGYILRIVSTTAFAHVVSVASGKVNGGSNTTITFTSAAIGDGVTLLAYQGVWYVIGSRGTITIS